MSVPTIARVQSRIHNLTGRPPIMTKDDLAEFYGTTPSNLMRRVRENEAIFTPDLMIELTPEEEKLCRGGTTSQGKRVDLAQFGFTELGALMVATILKSERSREVAQTIIRAFVILRNEHADRLRTVALKLKTSYIGRSKMKLAILLAAQEGWTFGKLYAAHDWSEPLLARTVEEMRLMGFIPQSALFVAPYVLTNSRRAKEAANLDAHAEDEERQGKLFGPKVH